tara:strand:- start:61 stop:1113 length:1053 start_codon:yes stop_codon:yes gene_type:complete
MLINNYLEIAGIIPLVIYRVQKRPITFGVITLGRAILSISIGILLIIICKNGISGRYLGILFSNFIFLAIYIFSVKNDVRICLDLKLLRAGLKYSLPIIPATFAVTVMSSIDRLMIERVLSIKDVGIYSIAVSLGSILLIFIRGFYLAIEPYVFQLFDNINFSKEVVKYKIKFNLIILIIGLIIIVFSKEIVGLIVTPEYHEAQIVIPFIVLACIFRGLQVVVDTVLYAADKTIYHPIIIFTGLFVNIALNIKLIPLLGILGAAISSSFSFWLLYIGSVLVTTRYASVNWYSIRITIFILTLFFISLYLGSMEYSFLPFTILVKSFGLGAIGMIVYIAKNYFSPKIAKVQ